MYIDIVELQAFYATPLGHLVRRLTVQRLKRLWSEVEGQTVVGLGYAAPFLDVYRGKSERCIAFMPARQGVAAWPSKGKLATALVDEADLPLNDSSIERLLLAHCLETTEDSRALLREAWRILTPGGRLAVIVPNRRGLWARLERTPFGQGRPYSRRQLSRLLREASFSPRAWEDALWVPPFRSRMMIRSAPALERIGALFPGMPAGIVMVDATKEVRQAIPADAKVARRLKILPVPEPVASARREVAESSV